MLRQNQTAQELIAILSARFEAEIQDIQRLVDEKELEIAEASIPYFERRQELSQRCEFLRAQLKTIDSFLANPHNNEASLNTFYQGELLRVIEYCVSISADTVEQRKHTVRDGRWVNISTPEQKAAEVEHYRTKLMREVLPSFRDFHFNVGTDFLALQQTLKKSIEEYNKAVADSFEEQSTCVGTMMMIKERLGRVLKQKEISLREQRVLLNDYHPTLIEQICARGDLAALQAELRVWLTNHEKLEHLNITAPNALHLACWSHHIALVEYLLELGVSERAYDSIPISATHTTHYTPMHYVAMRVGDDDTVRACLNALRDRGAILDTQDNMENPDFPSYGRTPLHTAAFFGNQTAVQWCVEEAQRVNPGNNVILQDFINRREKGRKQTNTAVHNAAYAGQWDSVIYLLHHGADARETNYSENTALMEALCSDRCTVEQRRAGLLIFAEAGITLSKDEFERLTQKTRSQFDQDILPVLEQVTEFQPLLKPWIREYRSRLVETAGARVGAGAAADAIPPAVMAGLSMHGHFSAAGAATAELDPAVAAAEEMGRDYDSDVDKRGTKQPSPSA